MKPKEQVVKWLLLLLFISSYVKSEYFAFEKSDDFSTKATDKIQTKSLEIQSKEEKNEGDSMSGLEKIESFRYRAENRVKLLDGRHDLKKVEISQRLLRLQRIRSSLKSDLERRYNTTRRIREKQALNPQSTARHADLSRSLNSRRHLPNLVMERKNSGQRYAAAVVERRFVQNRRSQDLSRNVHIRSRLMRKDITERSKEQPSQKMDSVDSLDSSSFPSMKMSKTLSQQYMPTESKRRIVQSDLKYAERNSKQKERLPFYKVKVNKEQKLGRKSGSGKQQQNRIYSEKASRDNGEHRLFRELLSENLSVLSKGLQIQRRISNRQPISTEKSTEAPFGRSIRLNSNDRYSFRKEEDAKIKTRVARDERFRSFQRSREDRSTYRNDEKVVENRRQITNLRERYVRDSNRVVMSEGKQSREAFFEHSFRHNQRSILNNILETRINIAKSNFENELAYTRDGKISQKNQEVYVSRERQMQFSALSGLRDIRDKNLGARGRRKVRLSERLNRKDVAAKENIRSNDRRIDYEGKENKNSWMEARINSFEPSNNARHNVNSRRIREQLQNNRENRIIFGERINFESNLGKSINRRSVEKERASSIQNDRIKRGDIRQTEINRNVDRRLNSQRREQTFMSSNRNGNTRSSNGETIRSVKLNREQTSIASAENRNRNINLRERKISELQDKNYVLMKEKFQMSLNGRRREVRTQRTHEARTSRSNGRESQSRRQNSATLRERSEEAPINQNNLEKEIRLLKPIGVRSRDRRQETNVQRNSHRDSQHRSVEDLKRAKMTLTERNRKLREEINTLRKRSVEDRNIQVQRNHFRKETNTNIENAPRMDSRHGTFIGKEREFFRQKRVVGSRSRDHGYEQADVRTEREYVQKVRNIKIRSFENVNDRIERNLRQISTRQPRRSVRSPPALKSGEFSRLGSNLRKTDERSTTMVGWQTNRAFSRNTVSELSTDSRSRPVSGIDSRKMKRKGNTVLRENISRESKQNDRYIKLRIAERSAIIAHRNSNSLKKDANSIISSNSERMRFQNRLAVNVLKERNRESQRNARNNKLHSIENRKFSSQSNADTFQMATRGQSINCRERLPGMPAPEKRGKIKRILQKNLPNTRTQFAESRNIRSRIQVEFRKMADITNEGIRNTGRKSFTDRRELSVRNGRGYRGKFTNLQRGTDNMKIRIREKTESNNQRRNSNASQQRLLPIKQRETRLLNQRNGRGFRGKLERELRLSNSRSTFYLKSARKYITDISSSNSQLSNTRLDNLHSSEISALRKVAQIYHMLMERQTAERRTNSNASLNKNVRRMKSGQIFMIDSMATQRSSLEKKMSKSSSRRKSDVLSPTYHPAEFRRHSNLKQIILPPSRMVQHLRKSEMRSGSIQIHGEIQLPRKSDYQRKRNDRNRIADTRTSSELERSLLSLSSSSGHEASSKILTGKILPSLRTSGKIYAADDRRLSKQTRSESDGSNRFVFLVGSTIPEYNSALGSISMPAADILEKYKPTAHDSLGTARFMEGWNASGQNLATLVFNVVLGILIMAAAFKNDLQLKSKPFREKLADVIFLRC